MALTKESIQSNYEKALSDADALKQTPEYIQAKELWAEYVRIGSPIQRQSNEHRHKMPNYARYKELAGIIRPQSKFIHKTDTQVKEIIKSAKSKMHSDTIALQGQYVHGETPLSFSKIPSAYAQGYATKQGYDLWSKYQGDKNAGKSELTAPKMHKATFVAKGGSALDFNKILASDLKAYNQQQVKSAGLAKVGNAQIKKAHNKEMQKLGNGTKVAVGSKATVEKSVIKAQNFPKEFLQKSEIKQIEPKPAPKGTKQDPFKAKQPDLSKLSPYLKPPTKKPSTTPTKKPSTTPTKKPNITPTKLQVRIDNIKTESQQKAKAEKAFAETKKPQTPSSFTPWRVGEKSFFTKQAAENYGLSHQPVPGLIDFQTVQTYTVTTPDGKTRTFNNESTANEFLKGIKGSYQTYGSYIGFGPDGAPIQGPPKPEYVESEVIIPSTMMNFKSIYTVEYGEKTYEFTTKKEANQFIEKIEMEKPFTDAKYLPLESLYSWVDKGARFNKKNSEENPNDVIAAIMSAGSSFQAGIFNTLTLAGDLLDEHIIKRPVLDKRQVVMSDTYYDKGVQEAISDVDFSTLHSFITSFPSLNPRDDINIFKKAYAGSKEQWNKQTAAQNLGQSIMIAPVVAFDIATWGQGGLALIRNISKPIVKLAVKPTLPKLIDATIQSTKITTKTIKTSKLKGTTRANEIPQSIGIIPKENMIGKIKLSDDFIPNKSEKPFIPRTDIPIDLDPFKVKADLPPMRRLGSNQKDKNIPARVDYDSLFGNDNALARFDITKITLGKGIKKLPVKTHNPNYITASSDFVDFQKSLIPKSSKYDNIVGKIKLSKDFIPNKYPNRIRKNYPKGTKPVEIDPFMKTGKVDLDRLGSTVGSDIEKKRWSLLSKSSQPRKIKRKVTDPFKDDTALARFDITKITLGKGIKKLPVKTHNPNYITASSDFVDFQKSLIPKSSKYDNIVGKIKLSKDFIPNKYPNRIRKNYPKGTKPVEIDPFMKTGKVDLDRLGSTVGSDIEKKRWSLLSKSSQPRKIKRKVTDPFKDDTALAGITNTKVKGGTSAVVSSKQNLVLIQKTKKISKKKLQTNQNPTAIPRDFTITKIDKIKTPKSSNSPILVPLISHKEKKKKSVKKTMTNNQSTIQISYPTRLATRSAVTKSRIVKKTITNNQSTIQISHPTRLATRSAVTKSRIVKSTSSNLLFTKQKTRQKYKQSVRQSTKQILRQPQKQLLKQPQKQLLKQPQKQLLKQPQKQLLKQPQKQLLKQPQKQLLKQPQKQLLKQPQKQLLKQPQKQLLKQPLRPPPKRPLKLPRPPRNTTKFPILIRKPPGIILPGFTFDGVRKSNRRKRKDGRIFEFVGNSRSDNMIGIFDRDEVTYGKKNIAKIQKSDRAFIKKSNQKTKSKKSTFDIDLDL